MKKVCSICKIEKVAEEFSRNNNTSDKLHTYCKPCTKEKMATWYKLNRALVAKKSKENYIRTPERVEYRKLAYAKSRDTARKSTAEWKRLNKDRVNATKAKRRATKLMATPAWLSKEQITAIDTIYWLSIDLERVSGEKYHVDHIVPLLGKNVCGLHVPWNLQILPADINTSKGNTYEY